MPKYFFFILFLASSLSVSAQTGGPAYRPPFGVYCSCGPTTGVGSGSVAPAIAAKPFVQGILVRVGWQLLEPQEGQYNWSLLDGQLNAARSYGKKVSLGIGCGIAIPQWVFDAGAKRLLTSVPYADTIAVPWDPVFLTEWSNFIAALGKRYDPDTSIVLVYMTSSTGNGYEMQLPFVTNPTLAAAGYSDPNMISSWETVVDAFGTAFPSHYLSNDFHPVNGSNTVADAVYAYAAQTLGNRYGASAWWWTQKNTTVYPAQYALLQQSAQSGLFTGVQMAYNGTNDSASFGPGGMPGALQLAINLGVCYWEIWNQDILNPNFENLLSQADCSGVTAVHADPALNRVSVYPNPTPDFLNIDTELTPGRIRVFDANGSVRLVEGGLNRLDLRALQAGCYIVEIELDGRIYRHRVVIW